MIRIFQQVYFLLDFSFFVLLSRFAFVVAAAAAVVVGHQRRPFVARRRRLVFRLALDVLDDLEADHIFAFAVGPEAVIEVTHSDPEISELLRLVHHRVVADPNDLTVHRDAFLGPDLLLELPDRVEHRHVDLKRAVDAVGLGRAANGTFGRSCRRVHDWDDEEEAFVRNSPPPQCRTVKTVRADGWPRVVVRGRVGPFGAAGNCDSTATGRSR